MHRLGIGGGVDGDGGDAEFAAGALHAKRDFAAIRDQDFAEHLAQSMTISTSPYSTGTPALISTRVTVPARGRLDLVERLHRFDEQHGLPGGHGLADGDERRRAGFWREIGDTDHRAFYRARMLRVIGHFDRGRRRGGGEMRRGGAAPGGPVLPGSGRGCA